MILSIPLNTIVYIIVYLLAIIFFISGCYLFKKSKQTIKWGKTKGSIYYSELSKQEMDAGSPVTYKAKVKYLYTINGKEYNSKRIFFGDFVSEGLPYNSKKLLKKYQKGSEVDIYYNTLKPEESVLERGIHFNVYLLFITSFLLIVYAFFFDYLVKSS